MASILSSCLILLKLAMAVNDGLHTMLSNIYSVIENAMQSDQNRKENDESVQEASSAPAFQRSLSKSQILEAFNRRRANLAIYEQTDVLVSNLTPFQEITITNKDIEGKRKRSLSSKKSPCKRAVIESNSDIESNVETHSQSESSSLVSSDIEIDSEVQSCKVIDDSAQMEEAKDVLCREKESLDEPTETMDSAVGSKDKTLILKEISPIATSRASRSSLKNSLKSDLNFQKSLQEQIKLTNENLRRAPANVLSSKNIWGLTDSDSSNEKGENLSTEVRSKYATSVPEDSVSSQNFLKEATRLYEEFLNNYCTERDARTDSRKNPNESPRAKILNSNPTSSKSNGNKPAFQGNISPIRRVSSNSTFRATTSDGPSVNASYFEQNSEPSVGHALLDYCSDRTGSDLTGFGYFSDAKPMSRVSATKHLNTCRVPLSLNKDSWIKMDDDISMNKKSFQKLCENPTRSDENEWNMLAASKELSIDLDCDYQSHPKNGGLFSVSNPSRADSEDVLEASQDFQDSIGYNLSSLTDYQLDDSDDLEAVSFARVDTLAKLLQDVGATEVLNEPNVDEHASSHSSNTHITKLVNDFSDIERSFLAESNTKNSTATEALKSTSASNNNILDFKNIPFKDLDTEEKQLNYLDNITERYLLHCTSIYGSRQESFPSMEHTLFEDFEERHKIMLDTITKAYRHELDSLTRSAGICLDDSSLVEMGSKTNLDFPFLKREATSRNKDCWNPSTSPKETAIGELDAFGLPFFVQNKTKADDKENVDDKNASFEVKREANCCVNEYPGLLEMDKDHSGTFTIDRSHNETSTPIKDEKLEEQSWISINLSSESQTDFGDATSDDAKPNHCFKKFINPTSFNKDAKPCLIENEMENKHELACSHDANNVKDGILVPKDWRDLAAEMSKNYDMCISILNKCDDDAGNSNLNKESNCNEHKESCKGKTDMGKTETNCEMKGDLPRCLNRKEPYLNITQDVTEINIECNTDNMVSLEERESNTVLHNPNDTCSTSDIKYVESAFFTCENYSPLEAKEIHANSKNTTLKSKVSLIGEHDDIDSENNDDVSPTLATNFVDNMYEEKDEVQVSANTKVDLCLKPKSESDPKQNPSQNSEAVRLKEFPSTINMALANGELQNKTSLGKRNFLNEEFLSNNFDREVEFYQKCVKSKVRKNDGEVKKDTEPIHPSDHSGTHQELKSMQIGKPSTEEMSLNPGKSTPMSNIEDLRQREELESTRIYDDCVILNNETVNATLEDRHLPLEDSEPNTNAPFISEAKVLTLQHGVENELSYDVEVNNNIQIAENSLVVVEETKNECD